MKRYTRVRLFKQRDSNTLQNIVIPLFKFLRKRNLPFPSTFRCSQLSFHRNTADVFGKISRTPRVFLPIYVHMDTYPEKAREIATRCISLADKNYLFSWFEDERECNDRDKKKRKRGTLRVQYSCGVIIFLRYFPTNVFAVARRCSQIKRSDRGMRIANRIFSRAHALFFISLACPYSLFFNNSIFLWDYANTSCSRMVQRPGD